MPLERNSETSVKAAQDQVSEDLAPHARPPLPPINLFQGQSVLRSVVRVLIFMAIAFLLGPALTREVSRGAFRFFRVTDSSTILLFFEVVNFAFVLALSVLQQ